MKVYTLKYYYWDKYSMELLHINSKQATLLEVEKSDYAN